MFDDCKRSGSPLSNRVSPANPGPRITGPGTGSAGGPGIRLERVEKDPRRWLCPISRCGVSGELFSRVAADPETDRVAVEQGPRSESGSQHVIVDCSSKTESADCLSLSSS